MEQQQQLPATPTPNPLAADSGGSSSNLDSPSDSDAVAASAVASNENTAPSPSVGMGYLRVPNPILDASSAAVVSHNNTTIAPSPMVSKKSAPAVAAAVTIPDMTSVLVPSPLPSPSASPQYQQHYDNDNEMETTRGISCDEPPKKEQRLRSNNTIEEEGGYETLQPVNFGNYGKSPRKDSVESYATSGSAGSHDNDTYSTQCPTPLSPADHHHHIGQSLSGGTTTSPITTASVSFTATAGGPDSFPHFSIGGTKQAATTSAAEAAAPTGNIVIDKRQKRLERNRESARASRRRRKQYLEELENKVQSLSTEMDSGRMHHALESIEVVSRLREDKILEILERVSDASIDDNIYMNDDEDASRGSNIIARSSSGVRHNVTPKTMTMLPQTSAAAPSQHQQSSQVLLKNANVILTTSLSRTQPSFHVVNAFLHQQLKSLILTQKQPISTVANSSTPALTTSAANDDGTSSLLGPLLPSLTQFLLWLTLQNDNFFRGGRAQSERLSAARIGERLLHGGLYRVTPSTTAAVNHNKSATHYQQHHNSNKGKVLWPLLCHEIGLSYDQEDKIRTAQRTVLQNVDLWVHRHTARATSNVIQSIHDVIGGMTELTRENEEIKNAVGLKKDEGEETLLSILTEEQRMKFLKWALKSRERMKWSAERNVGTYGKQVGELEVSNERHVAANLYIIDYKLGKIKQRVPPIGEKYVHPSKLKKLGRRPCFESLGGNEKDSDTESATKMTKEKTFPSTGSLKRSLDEMSIDETTSSMESSLPAITPEAAQSAGQAAASLLLKDVLSIIPKPPMQPRTEVQPVISSTSTFLPQQQQQEQQHQQQQHRKAASTTFDDIPMPTPVSVLLQTPDDLFAPGDGGGVNEIMGVDPPSAAPEPFYPEPVASSPGFIMSRHQSAPEFGYYHYHYSRNSSAPMGMVPVPENEEDFFLDDLPMDADDWLIGDDTLEF